METVVARALEQKKESDMKVHELELRVCAVLVLCGCVL